MEKTCCRVNVVEIDNGYRVEFRGDKTSLKEAWAECCGGDVEVRTDCCGATVREVPEGFDLVYRGDKDKLRSFAQKICATCCGR